MIHVDANFLIDALVPGSPQEARLVGWLSSGEAVGMSSMAWGEFLCGPLSPAGEEIARRLFPDAVALDRLDAERAAFLFNQTGRRAKTYADCCIVAIAIRVGASLATSNHSDFVRMVPHGLVLV